MNSLWPIQILLLLLTSHCDSRSPRGCGRKFHFDFERGHPSQYEGGVWQGLEGQVTFRGGKAWLDGHGSLIYPFFSHNDLRTGFAFSFKIKPAKIAPGGRAAIITNGVDAGSSTLTVFHNGTCLGVKVVEIAETWNPAEGIDFSRNVELSVDYTKQIQRLKRSSDTAAAADVYIDPIQSDDDMNNGETKNDTTGPLETSEKGPRFSSGEHSGNHGDVADDGAREDNGASTVGYDIIAVRKLYKEDTTNTHSSANQVDIVTENPSLATSMYNHVQDTLSTTTTTTTITTTTTTMYSDIADTPSTTTYKHTTELPSTSTHVDITETSSTTTHSDITDVQSTTTYTPSTTTHIDTMETASTTRHTPSTTTYSEIVDTPSTATHIDTTETTSTTTYTPSMTTYSEDTETIEQTYTDNRSTNSDSESDTNSSTPQGGYTSSRVSDHTATTLTDSAPDVSVSEQTTPTPQSTTDFVVHRQPSHSVHIDSATEQTTATHVSSGISIQQQTTMPPTTTSRGLEERVVVPRRNRFLIIPNIFRGLQEEDPDEIEVRLAQDNGVLRLQVGESAIQETTVGVTEHMKAPRSALRVGAGDGLLAYRGSFDEFSMYDCAPVNFFNDEN